MNELLSAARQIFDPRGRRFAQMQGNLDCNRDCTYCDVPSFYNKAAESTLAETFEKIDWLHRQGFRLLSYIGGETLAPRPYITKEGISFYEHTREVVRYAKKKGIVATIVSNGDYVTEEMIEELRIAGLDSLTFSLHTLSRPALNHLISVAKIVSSKGIIPHISMVLTSSSSEVIPAIAAHSAANGIPFSFGIVQEKGGGFSRINKDSNLPSIEAQKKVFAALLRLKQFGFIRAGREYMQKSPDFYPNNWRCDHSHDSFIHLDAVGNVDVCSDVRTGIKFAEINDLNDPKWRSTKKNLVHNCGNCLYQCYYDTEHPDVTGHLPYAGVAFLIKTGNSALAEKWGRFAVNLIRKTETNTNWDLAI